MNSNNHPAIVDLINVIYRYINSWTDESKQSLQFHQ
jgi:hypothetical protein